MELLALIKKGQQDKKEFIEEDGIGQISTKDFDLKLLFDKAFIYNQKKSIHNFTDGEIEECWEWCQKAMNFKGGAYNPLNLEIVDAEKSFDVTFDDSWAAYDFAFGGEQYTGQLGIKGNIDIITRDEDGLIQMLDYKTGKCKNWVTGKEKTYKDFLKDPQLLIYFYALSQAYPDDEILVTVYYINHGGPFTVAFDRSKLPEIKEMLRKRFEEIKRTKIPKLLSYNRTDYKCKNMCGASKQIHPDSGKCLCEHFRDKIKEKGLNYVLENDKIPSFRLSDYGSGGGREGLKDEKDSKTT